MRCRRRQKGQALTEFVLVFPLFFVILLGVVQLSLIYLTYQVVHYASFAACRAAVVRPCMAFNPDDYRRDHFTPTVLSAAVLANMAIAPAQQLVGVHPYDWMPDLPDSQVLDNLDFAGVGNGAEDKYINSAYLTGVRRVNPDYSVDPPVWEPLDMGPGPGVPCMDDDYHEVDPEQNVPPTGYDLSLEVTFLYPMQVPLVNRVFFGIWVNFTDVAADLGAGTPPLTGQEGRESEVMVLPTYVLPRTIQYRNKIMDAIQRVFLNYGYGNRAMSTAPILAAEMNRRAWYPIPVRARTTLTAEGSVLPMVTNWWPWPW